MPVPYGQNGSSLSSRLSTQYQQQFGRPADVFDPGFATWVKTAMPQMVAADQASYDRSKRRWGVADKVAMGAAAIPFAAAAAPALFGAGAAGGAGASAGSVPAAAGTATGTIGRMATLGKIFSSPGMELGVNAGLSLLGTHSAKKAADQARADQLAAQKEAIAIERQKLELEATNANLDREDQRALNAAINELKKRELDAAEEERAFNRGLVEQRETRLAPYRDASGRALQRLQSMWGI